MDMKTLKSGVAVADITPPVGIQLAGGPSDRQNACSTRCQIARTVSMSADAIMLAATHTLRTC